MANTQKTHIRRSLSKGYWPVDLHKIYKQELREVYLRDFDFISSIEQI